MEIVSDLKPCPFCGGKGALEPHFYEGYDEEDNLCELVDYFVHCTKCGVSTPFMSCEESAQDAWEERYVGETPSADGYTSSTAGGPRKVCKANLTCSPVARTVPTQGEGNGTSVPTEEAVRVCCMECRHLERVNGRIVAYRCRMTNISFAKYGMEVAPIDPKTFYCKFADGKKKHEPT